LFSYAFEVADRDDGVGQLRPVHDLTGYRMHLMLNDFTLFVPPLPDDFRLAYRPPQPEVSASYASDLFPVEVGFAGLDCGSQFPYAHVDWEDACVLAFESGFLLDGDVHEPVPAVPNQSAFSQIMF